MVNRSEFYNTITQITQDGIRNVNKLIEENEKIQDDINSNKASASYVRDFLKPKIENNKRMIESIKIDSANNVNQLCDRFIEELKREDALKPNEITEDIKLLNCGIRLTKFDLQTMLERNNNNRTMQQLVLRYCEDNKVDIGVSYIGNKQLIQRIQSIPQAVKVSLKHSSASNVYNQLLGEESNLKSEICEE